MKGLAVTLVVWRWPRTKGNTLSHCRANCGLIELTTDTPPDWTYSKDNGKEKANAPDEEQYFEEPARQVRLDQGKDHH
jgi:hypothetical protein